MRLYNQPSSYPVSLNELLEHAAKNESSDLHLVVGRAPCLRVKGQLSPLHYPPLSPQDIQQLLFGVLSGEQIQVLKSDWELDFSHSISGCARFRGNIIVQRDTLAAAFRVVPLEVPELPALGLPADVERLCGLPRGLVLVTGPTGSGKSTTLAAMLRRINETRAVNIMTIEDPIEFLHAHKLASVRQREVGTDTHSFAKALRQALRHDPDVIMIGEMRDRESMAIALTAAETGHLVLSTLHTQTAPLSITRIVDSFETAARQQIRQQLAASLRAVISQQLVPTTDGGRALAAEYMTDTPAVRSMIREEKEHQLYSVLQTARAQGMQTMDQALAQLFLQGKIEAGALQQYAVDLKEAQRLIQSGL